MISPRFSFVCARGILGAAANRKLDGEIGKSLPKYGTIPPDVTEANPHRRTIVPDMKG
jgi:hypothetical protein